MNITENDIKRFYSKISFGFGEDACWMWKGGISFLDGRGHFWVDGETRLAPIVAYTIYFGKVILGKYVCHTCDNPTCVNPSHLFLGTNSDNMLDMYKKGRRNVKGENAPAHKLCNMDAKKIRELYASNNYTYKRLAEIYNMSIAAIQRIINNESFVEECI